MTVCDNLSVVTDDQLAVFAYFVAHLLRKASFVLWKLTQLISR